MYLHIGKNCVIKDNEVVGIFNIDNIKDTLEYNNLYEKLNSENKLEDISSNQKNSFILTSNIKKGVKGFISNIGTNTIKKRIIV